MFWSFKKDIGFLLDKYFNHTASKSKDFKAFTVRS